MYQVNSAENQVRTQNVLKCILALKFLKSDKTLKIRTFLTLSKTGWTGGHHSEQGSGSNKNIAIKFVLSYILLVKTLLSCTRFQHTF